MEKPKTIEAYIATFPREVRETLESLRDTIKKAAPDAEEGISYQMPAFNYHGPLVYFAGYKKHIGFYATPSGHGQFKQELSAYKQGKGSVQFPLDSPLPLDLVKRIVQFRYKENVAKTEKK